VRCPVPETLDARDADVAFDFVRAKLVQNSEVPLATFRRKILDLAQCVVGEYSEFDEFGEFGDIAEFPGFPEEIAVRRHLCLLWLPTQTQRTLAKVLVFLLDNNARHGVMNGRIVEANAIFNTGFRGRELWTRLQHDRAPGTTTLRVGR